MRSLRSIDILDIGVGLVLACQGRREPLAERVPVPFEPVDADLRVRLRREYRLVDDRRLGLDVREHVDDRREGKLHRFVVAHDGSQARLPVRAPFAPAVQLERSCGLFVGRCRECRRLYLGRVGEQPAQYVLDCVCIGRSGTDVVLDVAVASEQANLELER